MAEGIQEKMIQSSTKEVGGGMKENFCRFKSPKREINRPQLCSGALFSVIIDVSIGKGTLGLSNPFSCHIATMFSTMHSPLPFLVLFLTRYILK